MEQLLMGIGDLARHAETAAVTLGQLVDCIGIGWMHHLKPEDKERISMMSETLDEWRSRFRDMQCDYMPVAPTDIHEAKEAVVIVPK